MADQSETTANKPAEPRPCKMGCGFFGNGATGDCCSKCWRELQKKREDAPSPLVKQPPKEEECLVITEESDFMVTEPPTKQSPENAKKPVNPTPSKKKKKKTSYKSMMANMMHASTDERKVEKEKESLRKVTGGGAFSKIDKI